MANVNDVSCTPKCAYSMDRTAGSEHTEGLHAMVVACSVAKSKLGAINASLIDMLSGGPEMLEREARKGINVP